MFQGSRVVVGLLLLVVACSSADGPTEAAPDPLSVRTTALADAVRNVAYSQALAASGGELGYVWSVSGGSLPQGLDLTASTGVIAGVPTTASSHSFTVEVMSSDGQTASRTLTIDVNPPPALQPSALCSANPGSAIASFEDPNLDAAVRASLGVGAPDDLTCDLLATLTSLSGKGRSIQSLVGAQNLTSLYSATLQENQISDVAPLRELMSLGTVNLYGNAITDIGPLSGLVDLVVLELWSNPFTDLTPLEGLTKLEFLELWGDPTPISNISSLSGLTSLVSLYLEANTIAETDALAGLVALRNLDLDSNSVTDIDGLVGLTELSRVYLRGNLGLVNIQALLDNTGFGVDDQADLRGTGVPCVDIAALEAKGVNVSSDCP